MSLTLSRADLRALATASAVLASPFDFATVDAWRSAANRELRVLLGADSVGFLLPESGGLHLYSDEHDPAALARYPDLMPPTLGTGESIFQRMTAVGVATLERSYGEDFGRYLGSEYYNDYAGANGAHDTLAAMLPLHEAPMAGIQLWHAHPTRRKFGQREVDLLALLFPSIRAGILTYLRVVGAPGEGRRDQEREERIMAAHGLTAAERKVARQLAEGHSNREIAAALAISPHTAKRHTERVFAKLDVARRDQVARRLAGAREAS